MNPKPRLLLLFLMLIMAALLTSPWLVVGPGDRHVTRSKAVDELNQGGPGKSWRVEHVLGRDVAHLFAQGQGCYLSRTLGPR